MYTVPAVSFLNHSDDTVKTDYAVSILNVLSVLLFHPPLQVDDVSLWEANVVNTVANKKQDTRQLILNSKCTHLNK